MSGTAQLIASMRALCTDHPVLRKLCDDPFAKHFQGDGRTMAAKIERSGRLPNFHLWVACRTAFIDACTLDAVLNLGIQQVVLLGAGYDTRSARLGLSRRAKFYEVDAPGPQKDKLARIATIPSYPRDSAVYVSCDFERQNFLDELVRAGFIASERALFIIEGVLYYLTEAAIRATLSTIRTACHANCPVVYDMFTKSSMANPKNEKGVEILSSAQEPLRFGSNHILPLLYQLGYRFVMHHDFDEVLLAATGHHQYSNMYRFQYLVVAQGDTLCGPAPPPPPLVGANTRAAALGEASDTAPSEWVRPLAPLSVMSHLERRDRAKL